MDLYVIVEYGTPIQRAAMDAQENVRKAIESMTGLHVVRVDVHVQGVSFEKENNALQSGADSAALEAGDTEPEKLAEPEPEKPAEEEKTAEKSARQNRAKNPRSKKEKHETPEEEKPAEET